MLESAIIASAVTVGFGGIASVSDIVERRIPNRLTGGAMVVALLFRIAVTALSGHGLLAFLQGLAWPAGLFAALYLSWNAGLIGAGDIKLATAFSLLLPPTLPLQVAFILGTTLVGGVIAVGYLLTGALSPHRVAPVGQSRSWLRRLLRVERWRAQRRAGIPYAVAISVAALGVALSGVG